MIRANELDDVVRMTGVGIAIGKSRHVVVRRMRLRVAVMMTVIVSEDDAHAVAVTVRHSNGMVTICCREQNRDTRNYIVPGAKKSQKAQARGEATEPLRALCSGFHRRRTVGPDTCLVKMGNREMRFFRSLPIGEPGIAAGGTAAGARLDSLKSIGFKSPPS